VICIYKRSQGSVELHTIQPACYVCPVSPGYTRCAQLASHTFVGCCLTCCSVHLQLSFECCNRCRLQIKRWMSCILQTCMRLLPHFAAFLAGLFLCVMQVVQTVGCQHPCILCNRACGSFLASGALEAQQLLHLHLNQVTWSLALTCMLTECYYISSCYTTQLLL
jgi:hypothetical protein